MPKKKTNDGLSRTITGLIMAGVLFLILWLTSFSPVIFDILVLIFGALATFEMYKAVKRAETGIIDKKGYNVSKWSILLLVVIIYPLCYFMGFVGLIYAFLVTLLVAFIEFVFDVKKSLSDFGVNIFVLIYPMLILGLVFVLNSIYGMIPVLLAVGIALVSDATAYWVGVSLGKKKIFPKISPKKTYAGCIGGIFGGILGSLIVYLIFELGNFPTNTIFLFRFVSNVPVLIYIVIGAVLAVFSEIGDLAASRIKRAAGIKDYSSMLGSHGGVMDRIDSILFTVIGMTIIMIMATFF